MVRIRKIKEGEQEAVKATPSLNKSAMINQMKSLLGELQTTAFTFPDSEPAKALILENTVRCWRLLKFFE